MSEVSETSPAATIAASASSFSTSAAHPHLGTIEQESVRLCLRKYDQYKLEIFSRALQHGSGTVTNEAPRPVALKCCVDPELEESAIALNFITGISRYGNLTDGALRDYFKSKTEQSKIYVSLDTLDALVENGLRMDMSNKNAANCMESLFIAYRWLLRNHGTVWFLKDAGNFGNKPISARMASPKLKIGIFGGSAVLSHIV